MMRMTRYYDVLFEDVNNNDKTTTLANLFISDPPPSDPEYIYGFMHVLLLVCMCGLSEKYERNTSDDSIYDDMCARIHATPKNCKNLRKVLRWELPISRIDDRSI